MQDYSSQTDKRSGQRVAPRKDDASQYVSGYGHDLAGVDPYTIGTTSATSDAAHVKATTSHEHHSPHPHFVDAEHDGSHRTEHSIPHQHLHPAEAHDGTAQQDETSIPLEQTAEDKQKGRYQRLDVKGPQEILSDLEHWADTIKELRSQHAQLAATAVPLPPVREANPETQTPTQSRSKTVDKTSSEGLPKQDVKTSSKGVNQSHGDSERLSASAMLDAVAMASLTFQTDTSSIDFVSLDTFVTPAVTANTITDSQPTQGESEAVVENSPAAKAKSSTSKLMMRVDPAESQTIPAPQIDAESYAAGQKGTDSRPVVETSESREPSIVAHEEHAVEEPKISEITTDIGPVNPAELEIQIDPAVPRSQIQAAWEVDAFEWPEVTDRLLSEEARGFETLLRALQLQRTSPARVVLVTGTRPEEGRSTLSICLARKAAASHLRTLLVDGDIIGGSLDQAAGLEFDLGWQRGEADESVDECLVRSLASNLYLMPMGSAAAEQFRTSDKYDRLWDVLRRAAPGFDTIIVDAGLVTDFGDYSIPAPDLIDAALLVQGNGLGEGQTVIEAYRHLVKLGIRSIAVAETFGRRMAG